MAPSTPLSIGTASLLRLVKEEASYHRELEDQQKRIDKLEKEAASGKTPDDEIDNSEYMLNQEVCVTFPVSVSIFLRVRLLICCYNSGEHYKRRRKSCPVWSRRFMMLWRILIAYWWVFWNPLCCYFFFFSFFLFLFIFPYLYGFMEYILEPWLTEPQFCCI